MKILLIISFILIGCSEKKSETMTKDTSVAPIEKNYYGAEPSIEGDAVTLTAAIDKNIVEKAIKVSSRVTNVCTKKGCWITLTEGETEVRVTFKDYGFFVPLDFKDVDVVVEGILSEKLIKEDERRHFAEDQGQSKEDVEKIVGDAMEYTFIATSVIKV